MARKKSDVPNHNAHLFIPQDVWKTFEKFSKLDRRPLKALVVDAMREYSVSRTNGCSCPADPRCLAHGQPKKEIP